MSLMKMKGKMIPPTPKMNTLRRRIAAAPDGRNFTPRRASGMRATMMRALKITADRTADCGLCSLMMLMAFSWG